MAKKKCPKCGSTNIAKIVYGLPSLNAMMKQGDEVYIGGCVIPEPTPTKHCNDCGEDFDFHDLINDVKK